MHNPVHAATSQNDDQNSSTSGSSTSTSKKSSAGNTAINNIAYNNASKGRFMKCVRCPTAYHVGDFCIAAGSVQLAGYNIICPNHFQPIKNNSQHNRMNVTWCFVCCKGGELLVGEARGLGSLGLKGLRSRG
jgi:hypothetical protein